MQPGDPTSVGCRERSKGVPRGLDWEDFRGDPGGFEPGHDGMGKGNAAGKPIQATPSSDGSLRPAIHGKARCSVTFAWHGYAEHHGPYFFFIVLKAD